MQEVARSYVCLAFIILNATGRKRDIACIYMSLSMRDCKQRGDQKITINITLASKIKSDSSPMKIYRFNYSKSIEKKGLVFEPKNLG